MRCSVPKLPRLPVMGWGSLTGPRAPGVPCLLDNTSKIFTTSGRASLLLAMEYLHIVPGDTVLLPTYHCPTMVAPVVALGATPVFYPIGNDGAPRLDWLQAHVASNARALFVVHFFGLPQPLKAIRAWCDARSVALVEDCAHAMFGRSGERPVGQWGDLAIGSLPKFFPVPEGGCLIVNEGTCSPSLSSCTGAQQIKAALNILEEGAVHGRLPGLGGLVNATGRILRGVRRNATGALAPAAAAPIQMDAATTGSGDYGIDNTLAHRRLTGPARWVATSLPRARIVERRRARYAELAVRLSGQGGMRPLRPQLPADCAPYVFPLWVDNPDPGYAEMRRRQEPVFRWDRRWPGIAPVADDQGLLWSHHVLQLACHQDLPDDAVESYARTIVELFGCN